MAQESITHSIQWSNKSKSTMKNTSKTTNEKKKDDDLNWIFLDKDVIYYIAGHFMNFVNLHST